MKKNNTMTIAALAGSLCFGAMTASASPSAKSVFDSVYPAAASTTACTVCHTGSPGSLTQYGIDYMGAGGTSPGLASAMRAIETFDPDGDGLTYLDEINNGTIAPVSGGQGTASVGGCLTSSASTPLMMLLAMLTLGFFIRRK